MRRERWAEYRGLRPWQVHSEILAVAGCVYIARGVMFIASDDKRSDTALRLPLHFAPMPVWGGVFVAVGLLALVSTRWPPRSKTWGYAALAGLAMWWALGYLFSVLLGAPVMGLGGALIWGLVAYIWRRVAALVNPDDVTAVVLLDQPAPDLFDPPTTHAIEPPKGR